MEIERTDATWVRRRLEDFGYGLCWRGTKLSFLWCRIWYRFYCPSPIGKNKTARACIAAGECGCDNNPRIMPPAHPPQEARR